MEFMDLLSNLCFPAAIAAWALWNSKKHEEYLQETLKNTLDENTRAVNELREAVISLKDVSLISRTEGTANEVRRVTGKDK